MDKDKIRDSNRWYVSNIIFRPKDENGLPIQRAPLDPSKIEFGKSARLDKDRFFKVYLNINEKIEEMKTGRKAAQPPPPKPKKSVADAIAAGREKRVDAEPDQLRAPEHARLAQRPAKRKGGRSESTGP